MHIERRVTSCRECPFFGVEGHGGPMVCDHPAHKTRPGYPYNSAIIRWVGNTLPIPVECPLRGDEAVITVRLVSA